MHIAICGYFYLPSGMAASKRILNLIEGLLENNVTVSVIAFKKFSYEQEEMNIINSLISKGVNINFAIESDKKYSKIERGIISHIAGKKSVALLKRIHKEGEIDALFLYGDSFMLLNPVISFAKKNNIITVLDIVEYRTKMIKISDYIKQPLALDILLGNLVLYKRVSGITAITTALKKKYANHNPIMLLPSIENWENILKTNNMDLLKSNFILMYIGSLIERDDPRQIEIILSEIKKNNYNIKVRFVGKFDVGTSGNYWVCKFRENYSEFVEFYSSVTNNKLEILMRSANGFLLTRKNETSEQFSFPTRLVECLKYSKPVFITDVGDISLYIKHGINGFLIDPLDAKKVCKEIYKVSKNEVLCNDIGMRGFESGKTYFNNIDQCEKLKDFIISLNI